MKRIFFAKYLIFFLICIVLVVGVIYTIGVHTVKEHYLKTMILNLKHLSETLIPSLQYFIERADDEGLDKFVKEIGTKIEMRITVIDTAGRVIADSKRTPALMENHRNRPEVEEALKGNIGSAIRYSSTINEDMLYVAIPIKEGDRITAVLRLSIFLKEINLLIGKLAQDIFWSLVGLSVITMTVFFILSLRWSRSIENLSELTKRVAEGDFSSKVLMKTTNELKELTNNFNLMTDKLKLLVEELKQEKEQLMTIINSMNEFLLVIDGAGKIVMSNKSFKDLMKDENVDERYYWEIIRSREFGELVRSVWKGPEKQIVEIELSGKIYTCSAVKLRLRDEAIFIFTDVSHIYLLDKVKKDLVANVSHELRTPLTAIKGFIETLDEEIDLKHKSYLDIIKKHTDRLIKIINDLLTLSYLEDKSVAKEFKRIQLKDLIKNIESLFQNKAKLKNIKLEVNVDENLPEIEGDEIQLENMLINLVENAINYTEEGKVSLNVSSEGAFVKIEVIDTGIGIPEESIERIFERFYVVDKSRSRKSGGSGLGLSIVKHIVLMHNGTIEVKSKLGEGTSFIIRFRQVI
jgi:two-component system phosphate regulon sensor histidine kinase PhoR